MKADDTVLGAVFEI